MKTKYVAIAAAVSIAAVVGTSLFFSLYVSRQEDYVPAVADIPEPAKPVVKTGLPDNWADTYNYVPSPNGITSLAKHFLKISPDYAGWIKMLGTKIDDAFTYDPLNEDRTGTQFYLSHSLDDTPSVGGAIFIDYESRFNSVGSNQSENIIFWGHNMKNDSMFGSLRKLRQNPKTYVDSPMIELRSNYEDSQYIIFGFLLTKAYQERAEFRYTNPETGDETIGFWNMVNLDTEDYFKYYVDKVRELSMYDTGIDVRPGDKLITLATCYKAYDNERFIVVARKLRPHETSFENVDRTEAYLEKIRQEEKAAATKAAE